MVKIRLNTLTKEGKKKYSNSMFSEKGYETLMNYTRNLTKMYFKDKFPLQVGIVLGIPMFKYASHFKNKKLLLEKIKAYAQLLGLKKIEVDAGATGKWILDLEGR